MYICFVEYTVVAMVLYICRIHHSSHGSYDIYYGDITLGCRTDYVTLKTTYNHVLYLFIDSMTWFTPALADLKVIMLSYVINEFKFQQVIQEKRRVCASITVLLDGLE